MAYGGQQKQGGNRSLDSYVGVHTRVEKFRADHPAARLVTNIVEGRDSLTVRAEVWLEGNDSGVPNSTGHASEEGGMGNRSQSVVEKVETAAVGRCLAFLGYEVKEGIASREEVQRAERATSPAPSGPRPVEAQPASKNPETHESDAELKNDQRGQGMAAAGLVRRDGAHFVVSNPSASGEVTTNTVTRNEAGRVVCDCQDFAAGLANVGPAYRCAHVYAVKHALISEPAPADPEPARLTAEINKKFGEFGYSDDDIKTYLRKYHEIDSLDGADVRLLRQVLDGMQ